MAVAPTPFVASNGRIEAPADRLVAAAAAVVASLGPERTGWQQWASRGWPSAAPHSIEPGRSSPHHRLARPAGWRHRRPSGQAVRRLTRTPNRAATPIGLFGGQARMAGRQRDFRGRSVAGGPRVRAPGSDRGGRPPSTPSPPHRLLGRDRAGLARGRGRGCRIFRFRLRSGPGRRLVDGRDREGCRSALGPPARHSRDARGPRPPGRSRRSGGLVPRPRQLGGHRRDGARTHGQRPRHGEGARIADAGLGRPGRQSVGGAWLAPPVPVSFWMRRPRSSATRSTNSTTWPRAPPAWTPPPSWRTSSAATVRLPTGRNAGGRVAGAAPHPGGAHRRDGRTGQPACSGGTAPGDRRRIAEPSLDACQGRAHRTPDPSSEDKPGGGPGAAVFAGQAAGWWPSPEADTAPKLGADPA